MRCSYLSHTAFLPVFFSLMVIVAVAVVSHGSREESVYGTHTQVHQ